jgi:hypothetical protein
VEGSVEKLENFLKRSELASFTPVGVWERRAKSRRCSPQLALLLYSLGAVQALRGAFAHLGFARFGRSLDGTEHELSSSLIQLKSGFVMTTFICCDCPSHDCECLLMSG